MSKVTKAKLLLKNRASGHHHHPVVCVKPIICGENEKNLENLEQKIDRLLKAQEAALMAAFEEKVTELSATIQSLRSEVERQKLVIEAFKNCHPSSGDDNDTWTQHGQAEASSWSSSSSPPNCSSASIKSERNEDNGSDTFSVISFGNVPEKLMLNHNTVIKMEMDGSTNCQVIPSVAEEEEEEPVEVVEIFDTDFGDEVPFQKINQNFTHHHLVDGQESTSAENEVLSQSPNFLESQTTLEDDLNIIDSSDDGDECVENQVKLKDLRIRLTPLKIQDLTSNDATHFFVPEKNKIVKNIDSITTTIDSVIKRLTRSSSLVQPPPATQNSSKNKPTVERKRSKRRRLDDDDDDDETRDFCCKYCKKCFKDSWNLIFHVRIHTGEKPYKCSWPKCGKRFTQLSQVQQHERIHRRDRPYKCSECKDRFVQKCHLDQHFLIHTGEKPFHCSRCPGSFRQKSALLAHIRLHHQEEKNDIM